MTLLSKNQRNEALTQEEVVRLGAFYSRDLMGFQRNYFLFQEGIISENYIRTNLPQIKSFFNPSSEVTLSRLEHWERSFRDNAPPAYREFIDQCVISECETIPR